jgi:small subunit ribosomal protein S17
MIGRVVSVKNAKTATVLVERTKTHPLYRKTYISSKKYLVDDSLGVKEGDVVEIVKIKPISKNKHFGVAKVLGQDVVALGTEAMKVKAKEAIEEVLPEEVKEKEAPVESPDEVKKEKK